MANKRRATQSSADELREALAQAYRGGGQALEELVGQAAPERRCASYAAFHYRTGPTLEAIPAGRFHSAYRPRLELLEFTLYGYCVERRFGWERTPEAVFSLKRPALWRRPAPLLALTVSASQEGVSMAIRPARRPGYKNRRNHLVRLTPELREQLFRIHQEQIAANSLRARFGAWIKKTFHRN
ncbi:hypothetical protein [Massilia endophytica]|uniref:hypothetical protein n=1 Tax=Massilia endophytica TaxID=2899220 RepID=UPI001E628BC7|nr:hypothetical protein [Massilia endophytica]UGQ48932.1 hypothetical protein LSQ66_10845 [Massilia endophytica]